LDISFDKVYEFRQGQVYNLAALFIFAGSFVLMSVVAIADSKPVTFGDCLEATGLAVVAVVLYMTMFRVFKTRVTITSERICVKRTFTTSCIDLADADKFFFKSFAFRPGWYVALATKSGQIVRSSLLAPQGLLDKRQNDQLKGIVNTMNEAIRSFQS
jgi:hypothetical protein